MAFDKKKNKDYKLHKIISQQNNKKDTRLKKN